MAFDQDDMYDLLDEGVTTIYLCGDKFSIPLGKKGITYIGVNNPVAVISSNEIVDWESKGIVLEGIKFDEEYSQLLTPNRCTTIDSGKVIFSRTIMVEGKAYTESLTDNFALTESNSSEGLERFAIEQIFRSHGFMRVRIDGVNAVKEEQFTNPAYQNYEYVDIRIGETHNYLPTVKEVLEDDPNKKVVVTEDYGYTSSLYLRSAIASFLGSPSNTKHPKCINQFVSLVKSEVDAVDAQLKNKISKAIIDGGKVIFSRTIIVEGKAYTESLTDNYALTESNSIAGLERFAIEQIFRSHSFLRVRLDGVNAIKDEQFTNPAFEDYMYTDVHFPHHAYLPTVDDILNNNVVKPVYPNDHSPSSATLSCCMLSTLYFRCNGWEYYKVRINLINEIALVKHQKELFKTD